MKTLILVRHAEAAKERPPQTDHDRPLSRRGLMHAQAEAKAFLEMNLRVDALVSSPAVRALSTAQAFAQVLSIPVQTNALIYEAGVPQLLETVRSLSDQASFVMLVGHNPGLSQFLRYLTDENYGQLSVCGMAIIQLPLRSWRHTVDGVGKLVDSNCLQPIGFPGKVSPQLHWRDRLRSWYFKHDKK